MKTDSKMNSNSDSITPNSKTIVSIGVPVFNGERFLRKCIESLLSQTFRNFEIIISDNGSTDLTPKICKEYLDKDSRIRYIRQKKNMGLNRNFRFTLKEARSKYFTWVAVDHFCEPDFLETNLNLLESNKRAACSTGKIIFFDENKISRFKKFVIGIRDKIKKPIGFYPINGTYRNKVRVCLNHSFTWIIFGIFRTEILKKSLVTESFINNERAIMLNVLKHGDLVVCDKELLHISGKGISKKGTYILAKGLNESRAGQIFPAYPFTKWCFQNLGVKLFFQNLDFFIERNIYSQVTLFIDLLKSKTSLEDN